MPGSSYRLCGFASGTNWRAVHFKDPLPPARICGLCGFVPDKIAVLPCSHLLCESCLQGCADGDVCGCPMDETTFQMDADISWITPPQQHLSKRQITYLRGRALGVKGLPPYSVFCEGVDKSSNGLPFLQHVWLYMFNKFGELLDTVFFVLLKKNGHITYLHISHHALALLTVWLDLNNGITGQVALFPILNSAVHTVMYTYYGLSALPSSVRPNLWWKKYVTLFQIIQFIVCALHGAITLLYDCGFPPTMAWIEVTESSLFAWLFSRFYYHQYIRHKAV